MKQRFLLLAMSAALMGPASATAPTSAMVGYDFGYSIDGDARITPMQIFDDGKITYFQFRGSDIPAIFTEIAGQVVLLQPEQRGQFFVTPGVHVRYLLQMGSRKATVQYIPGQKSGATNLQMSVPTTPAILKNYDAQVSDVAYTRQYPKISMEDRIVEHPGRLTRYSTAVPLMGDETRDVTALTTLVRDVPFAYGNGYLGREGIKQLKGMLDDLRDARSIKIVARDDDSDADGLPQTRARALMQWMVKNGISDSVITIQYGGTRTGPKKTSLSDITIEKTRERSIAPVIKTAAPTGRLAEAIAELAARKLITQDQAAELLLKISGATATQSMASAAVNPPSQATRIAPAVSPTFSAPVSVPVNSGYTLEKGKSIRANFEKWLKENNWKLVWEASIDFPVNEDVLVRAKNPQDAVRIVMGHIPKENRLIAQEYANNVIVISTNKPAEFVAR